MNDFQIAMRIHYPKSFLKLLLIGFAFAILPLMLAFINANIAFHNLSKNSQSTISNAVLATRASLILQEQLHLMERSTRQYFVLHDNELLKNYHQSRAAFNQAVSQLSLLTVAPKQLDALATLSQSELSMHRAILDASLQDKPALNFLNDYHAITLQIEQIINENNRIIDNNTLRLAADSKRTQKRFLLQSLVIIPLTLLVSGLITFMIVRPIRRMDNAIKQLGKGEYEDTIAIDGPGDLRVLGQRLDWLRNELNNLKAQKQQFLQHISHELKTPLTAIREATELLSDGVGGNLTKQQLEIAHILRDNSIRLQKMIENLLNFTKMESGNLSLKLQLINMKTVVDKVIQSHALSIRNKQLNVNTNIKADTLILDEDKVFTILDNLISNAIKYTPKSGNVDIIVSTNKQWVILEVKDDGPGLGQLDSEQLFDPFYQGKTLHQGLVNSTGLGLTIAKNLVEIHKGSITLNASAQGAHFIVRIPKMDLA